MNWLRSLLLCLLVGGIAGLLAAAPAATAPAGALARARPRPHRPGPTVLRLGPAAAVQPIAPGFLGLSLEYWAVPLYAGADYVASYVPHVDPVFLQLVRNLTGAHPVLRIGGDTTDSTWWPVPGAAAPAGVSYALTPSWVRTARALTGDLSARLILGINFEADSARIAATEAKALVNGIGRRRIAALELGNEPELYDSWNWGGSGAPGRAKRYDFSAFDRDFSSIARALPNLPLAGPAVGAPPWFRHVGRFLSDQRRVVVATLHRYPLQLCYIARWNPRYPSISHLFSAWSTRTLAASVTSAVKAAHARRVPVRIDEMNTVGCGDAPTVSSTFATALWGLDALFQMASVGVDGVNMHTFPGAGYQLFTFSRAGGGWQASVAPEYYGLQMFAQAAPAGSRLLSVSPAGAHGLKTWATRASDGTIRVVVVNESARARNVAVQAGNMTATGSLERLQAPGLLAGAGITLGGQSYGAATRSGRLAGRADSTAVRPAGGRYGFRVPGFSAALLTLPG